MGITGRQMKSAIRIMIMTLALLIIVFLAYSWVGAADIKLAWDANTETDLAGYNVYYGTTARVGIDPKVCVMCGYVTKVPLGKVTSYTITGLTKETAYWISVTAFDDSANESGFSNEVTGPAKDYTVPIDPKNLKINP